MLNYILTNARIYAYNLLYSSPKSHKKYQNLSDDNSSECIKMKEEEFKEYRLNTLMYIKQCKNTYYKYTQHESYNDKLYECHNEDTIFDNGETAFDDGDDISIFDKYIIEYIKNRNDIITYYQCKNIKINLQRRFEDLTEYKEIENEKDILFVIDMSDKQIFDYCMKIQQNFTINETKMIALSMVFKYDNEYVRIKLNSYKNNVEYYPRLVLENYTKK